MCLINALLMLTVGNNKEKARNRRRRQRADADLSDPNADPSDGTAGIQSEGYYSSSSYAQDKDAVADLYDEVHYIFIVFHLRMRFALHA